MSHYIDSDNVSLSYHDNYRINTMVHSWNITPNEDFLNVTFEVANTLVGKKWFGNFKLNFERDKVWEFSAFYDNGSGNCPINFCYYQSILCIFFRKYSYIDSSQTKACR